MKATGAAAVLGVRLDCPSDTYSIGHPSCDLNAVTAPATGPTVGAGSSGLLTGTFSYRVAYGQKDGALTTPSALVTVVGAATAVGTPGQNDATSGGTYTGSITAVFDVIVDAENGPDTFRWRKDSGSWTAGVAMTGAAQTLSDGVTVTFGATTGHTAQAWSVISTAVPTPGLDDLAVNPSTFTGFDPATYDVEIDSVAGPDTFKWRKNGGTWATGVAITGGDQTVFDGIILHFTGTTGHTLGDAWTVTVTIDVAGDEWTITAGLESVTLSAQAASLTSIPTSANTKVDRRVLERTDDDGATWAICGTIYDNTTVIFTDNAPASILDKSKVLPSVNQTGANFGYTFLEPDSFDLQPDFSTLPVVALLGTAGQPRAIPGPIKIQGSPKADLRPCDLYPIITAGGGEADSYDQISGEPTRVAVWNATTGKRAPRTLSFFAYEGSKDVAPNFLDQVACDELDFAFSGGKITQITPKFTGANYGTCPPAVKVSGGGSWLGSFAALGQRYDADALTKSVFIKITSVLSSNLVKFKVSVDTHASAGGGTYGDEYTLYTNATSHNQIKGGTQYNDSIELADQNGLFLGADVGSNRQPFGIIATAPLTTDLHVSDIYEILPTAAIPGVGSAPYSGVPARFSQGPRFTDAHVNIYYGGSIIEATSGSLKLSWPKKAVNALGSGARTVVDMPNEGFFKADLTITRFLDSSTYRQVIRTDARAEVQIELLGERIPVNPGVLSTYRESLVVDLPQMRFTSVKAPVTGQVLVVETIVGEAEQPDDAEKDLYTLTLTSRQGWTLPS